MDTQCRPLADYFFQGFKVHADPQKNKIDAFMINGLINELTSIQNLIINDDLFIAGCQIGRLQGDLVILLEQLEEKQKINSVKGC